MSEITPEDGETAVRAARRYAEAEVVGKTIDIGFPPSFDAPRGVFVTISEYPSGHLRGCIGYAEPVLPLKTAVRSSAVAACHDPRFPPLTPKEAAECTFEVTVLTPPETVVFSSSAELLSKIEIGVDGLTIGFRGKRGLLLPQVPVEWGWDAEEYLAHLSVKAGLPEDAWKRPGIIIEKFRGEIYSESSPNGEIVRK
ncbi:MAG: TIGR00296 family protein [Candidatus Methanoplasma sp.]|jgi:uncharacterized protein (TIGR00296 family)|nr:TIGR00296 family protein [Candidatus Methanoplasma sp.]